MALLRSPALDTGDNSYAPDTDARGLPRISNGIVDVGAYEYQVLPVLTLDAAGNVTFTGSPGKADRLTINLASGTYTFTDTGSTGIVVNGAGASNCTGSGTQTVTCPASAISAIAVAVGSGANTVNLRGTGVPTSITDPNLARIRSRSGSLAPSLGGTLAGIQAALTIASQIGTSTLTVDDSGDTTGFSYNLTSTAVTQSGGVTIAYSSLTKITILAGSGNDTLNVGTPLPQLYTFNGGGGPNTIVGPNVVNAWTLSGTNAGKDQPGELSRMCRTWLAGVPTTFSSSSTTAASPAPSTARAAQATAWITRAMAASR